MQRQAAWTQAWPAAQTTPVVPHWHTPSMQRSAFFASQAEQAPPAVPHRSSSPRTQRSPSQQPEAQAPAVHRHWPARHSCPAVQAGTQGMARTKRSTATSPWASVAVASPWPTTIPPRSPSTLMRTSLPA